MSENSNQPSTQKFQIGDRVKIIGPYTGQANGGGTYNSGIGWIREILEIKPGYPSPYLVGVKDQAFTGWCPESSIELA